MNHGQKHAPVRPKSVSESLEQENEPDHSNVTKLEKTTTTISIQKKSSTNTSMGLYYRRPISFKQNGFSDPNSVSPKKDPQSSCQIFFWETLMTVALLIMALWMQSLPTRQLPQPTENDTWQSLEMMTPDLGF